jgi:hypothetical protein
LRSVHAALRYCVRCGSPIDASARRHEFAAHSGEPAQALRLFSTLFPHLPEAGYDAFRYALALGIAIVAGLVTVRMAGAAKKPGDGQDEVSLDLETVRAIAPKAQIYDYEAPQSADWSDIINRIVEDGKVQIASISPGRCEPVADPAVGDPDDVALASAEMSGLSIFVSSGDQGAYDCLDEGDGMQRDFTVAADYPAVSPHVIAVGGTYLSLHQDGSYLGEVAWQDPLGQSGSGGGLSGVSPKPAWQVGPGVANAQSTGDRQVMGDHGPGEDRPVGGRRRARGTHA